MSDEAVGALARWCREGKKPFLGVGLNCFTRRSFVSTMTAAIDRREPLTVSFLNPYYAIEASRDPSLRDVMDRFDILQPDGWGVVYGARLAGRTVPERVAIEDIERPLFQAFAERGAGVFLFGAEPGMAERSAATLQESFPGLRIVGTMHGWWDAQRGHPGWFEDADSKMFVDQIRDSGADVVLVGLPTPLQQRWVIEHAEGLGATIVMTVGAYFDHLAEGLDWYPRHLDRLHLDFAYRMFREPARLWRRYLFGTFTFSRLVLQEVWRAR